MSVDCDDLIRRAVILNGGYVVYERAKLEALMFRAEHGLTDAEFNDPVNQVLFAIQYPEAK